MTAAGDRHLRDATWLSAGGLPRLLALLDGDGDEARVVGGAVRNALLGDTPTEIDVATTALPEAVVARAQAAGLKCVPTGIEHGTVTVIVDGSPFEVTTLREDVETFGRRATVRFGRDWKADAERRDFTVNALSATRDGAVHDYVGGLADLAARRIRFIGEARQRIREDFLRILRFFRFHAAYGHGAPDADGLHAAILERAGLDQLSRERVRMELMKLMVAPGAVPTLAVMAEAGFVTRLLAAVPRLPQLERMAGIEAALGLASDGVRRLGALAVQIAEDAERLWERLRLSNSERDRLASMVDGWWRVGGDLSDAAGRRLLYRLGAQNFSDRVLFAWAQTGAGPDDTTWRRLLDLPQRWTPPRLPLTAAALIERGVPRGPALGAALARAEAAWMAADFPVGAEAGEALITAALSEA